MESEYKVRAYEKNQIKLYAVLGEADSRTVIFDIVEKSGVVSAVSNAQVTDLMLDLTGYTVSLNRIGSSAQAAGTIMDAQSGKVGFTLPADFCRIPGEHQCQIVLVNGTEKLCIIGIVLNVDHPSEESNDIEIIAGIEDGIIIAVYDGGDIYSLQSDDSLIFKAKRSTDDTQCVLSYSVSAEAQTQSGDGYEIVFDPADTAGLKGEYHYGIGLIRSGKLMDIIPDAVLTVKRSALV